VGGQLRRPAAVLQEELTALKKKKEGICPPVNRDAGLNRLRALMALIKSLASLQLDSSWLPAFGA
jgi:hypothetical protein